MHTTLQQNLGTRPTTLLELLAEIAEAKSKQGKGTDYPPLPKDARLLSENRRRDQDLLARAIAKRRGEGEMCDEWTFVLGAYGNNAKTASLGYASLLSAVAPEIISACKRELGLPE